MGPDPAVTSQDMTFKKPVELPPPPLLSFLSPFFPLFDPQST